MDLEERLHILSKSARFDLCSDCDKKGTGRIKTQDDRWYYPELVPDGKSSIMLRVLMTNRCDNNCYYCENASNKDFKEATLSPDEVASYFAYLYLNNKARSLFISSAVRGSAEKSMTKILETIELVRLKFKLPAYIHAKVLPGASMGLIRRTISLATRVSVNLEVPNCNRMEKIGSPKNYTSDLYAKVKGISEFLKSPRLKNKTQTTQFIVGAAGETDGELISTMSHLYNDLNLSRIYFSAYQHPGLEYFGAPKSPVLREHRLYQTDFLLRLYGFRKDEIPLNCKNNLTQDMDPKLAWAQKHPEFFPLEINKAHQQELLRVPGLGPVLVKRIIRERKKGRISSKSHLKELGISIRISGRYILVGGVKLSFSEKKQNNLFSAEKKSLYD